MTGSLDDVSQSTPFAPRLSLLLLEHWQKDVKWLPTYAILSS